MRVYAHICECACLTFKSTLIFSFDVYKRSSDIIFSVHVTSALNVGVEPQRASMLPGLMLLAAKVNVEVSVGFAALNWDMGACLCVAAEHAKCLALFMCDSEAICAIVLIFFFF